MRLLAVFGPNSVNCIEVKKRNTMEFYVHTFEFNLI